jgi:hypothetical protein
MLVPDITKIDKGETSIAKDQALRGAGLAHRALSSATDQLSSRLEAVLSPVETILVTDDPDLASSDAAYVDVTTGLEQLAAAADHLLRQTAQRRSLGSMLPAAGAVAGALPALVSLLSSRRAVSSFTSSPDDIAAVALVAGALATRGHKVRLDDFRLVPNARVFRLEKGLREQRSELIDRKVELEYERAEKETERNSAQGRIDELTRQLGRPTAEVTRPDQLRWRDEREDARADRDRASEGAKNATMALGLIDDLCVNIDAFLLALRTVPAGGKRSPIVLAALQEGLHPTPQDDSTPSEDDSNASDGDVKSSGNFGKVLFVAAAAGSVDQVFSDKPLWSKDHFHTVASASITYWVLDPLTSEVLNAGLAEGTAELKVKVGDSFEISPPAPTGSSSGAPGRRGSR